jgi:hypothetical protein
VIARLPSTLLYLDILNKVAAEVLQRQKAKLESQPSQAEQLNADLKKAELTAKLVTLTTVEPDITVRPVELRKQINPEAVRQIMALVLFYMRGGMDTDTIQPLIAITRRFIQKVVICKTPGHQPAFLEVHGLISSILAQMDVLDFMERCFVAEMYADFIEKPEAGEIDTAQKQKKLLDAYAEELSVKRLEWSNIQVSLVAGAGFEPAAFRL